MYSSISLVLISPIKMIMPKECELLHPSSSGQVLVLEKVQGRTTKKARILLFQFHFLRGRGREKKKEKNDKLIERKSINSNALSYLTRGKGKSKPKVQFKGKPQA